MSRRRRASDLKRVADLTPLRASRDLRLLILGTVGGLIAAYKAFDLIIFPHRRHCFGNEPYMMRRRWDYFVRYLMGAIPPHEYQIETPEPRF